MYKEIVQEQEEQIEQLQNMVDLLRIELQNKNIKIQQFEEEKEKYSKIFKLRKYIVVKENDE